jgi:YgiT-type zinc finger domain-containing protein
MGVGFQAEENEVMKCAACHGEMVTKKGEIDFRIEGRLYLARNVVYEECRSCGEKVLSPEMSQKLFDKIKKGDFVEEEIKLPILEGTYG